MPKIRLGLPASTWVTATAYTKNNPTYSNRSRRPLLQHHPSNSARFFSCDKILSFESHSGQQQDLSSEQQKQIPPYVMSRVQQDFSRIKEANRAEPDVLQRSKGKKPRVGIIGAGVSGLRSADVLLKQGVKVTILEGRDRIGGRFYQSDELGHRVDLGPNWIHGTENNPIMELAKETDTATMSWDGRQAIFDRLGRIMPDDEAAELLELTWEIIEQAMKYSNEESEKISPETSLYDYFQEKVGAMVTSQMGDEEGVSRKRQRVLDVAEMWGAFVGSPIQQQSLKFFWMEDSLDGENLFVAETYHKVLKKIAEPALKEAEIKFGYKVRKIVSHETPEGVSVTVNSWDKESLVFDEVVTTTPLGWLKVNKSAFEPELPIRLQEAISAIGYGHLDKVYITFPTAFWKEPPHSTNHPAPPPSSSQSSSVPHVTATTAPIHQPPSTPSLNFPGFIQYTTPTYASTTNPSHWAQEAMNLAALTPPHAHPTLLFYTYGPTSHHIASLLKMPSASPQTVKSILLPFFTPYISRLPNYDPANPAHQPTAMLATAWANDEMAGYGSYSNFQIGLQKGGEDVEVMRKGMPERGVWIAGEHTAPFAGLGTVNGAYWSGEGVAMRILGAYGLRG